MRKVHPELAYLHGNLTVSATFSIARFRTLPSGPRQLGQQVSLGLQMVHMRWPLSHW